MPVSELLSVVRWRRPEQIPRSVVAVVCAALVVACFLAFAEKETRNGKGVVLDVVHKLLVRVYSPVPLNVILGVCRGCPSRARP